MPKCNHGQLYLHVPVTIVIPIDHDSARCVDEGINRIGEILEQSPHTAVFKVLAQTEGVTVQETPVID